MAIPPVPRAGVELVGRPFGCVPPFRVYPTRYRCPVSSSPVEEPPGKVVRVRRVCMQNRASGIRREGHRIVDRRRVLMMVTAAICSRRRRF